MENETPEQESKPAPTMTVTEALTAFIELQAKAENLMWEHPQLRAILNDMYRGVHLRAWARIQQDARICGTQDEAKKYLVP